MLRGYYLGCPAWAVKTWVGRLYPEGTKPTELLAHYATVFNAVEGNTTFYALPGADQVARWADQTPPHFRFCFKFPRAISHDHALANVGADVATFLDRVLPLGERLGTLFLQLPSTADAAILPRLRAFLAALPTGPRYAVELRHPSFVQPGPARAEAVALLRDRNADLVTLDTRGLHATDSPALAEVRRRKPALPVLVRATADRPFVRFVPHEDFTQSLPHARQWAAQLARWLAEGKRPYFFMHAPDDTYAPANAYTFHALLRELADVGDLPPWQGAGRQLPLL